MRVLHLIFDMTTILERNVGSDFQAKIIFCSVVGYFTLITAVDSFISYFPAENVSIFVFFTQRNQCSSIMPEDYHSIYVFVILQGYFLINSLNESLFSCSCVADAIRSYFQSNVKSQPIFISACHIPTFWHAPFGVLPDWQTPQIKALS